MTSSNIKNWWHSFQLSVEWWKFGYHNVFLWQLPPFWVAVLFFFTSWWAFIFNSRWYMALEIQSPLETRNVALDNIIFTVNSLGIFVLNISFYTASCFILELIAVFRFFLQVVFGERIRPSLYNVSNSFYLRSCLDDFMFIWAIHQLISGYIY